VYDRVADASALDYNEGQTPVQHATQMSFLSNIWKSEEILVACQGRPDGRMDSERQS